MKLVYAFERLELVFGERTVNLLPTAGARRLFGYIVPVVRPWPLRIRWTGILMTLDLLASSYDGWQWPRLARRSASSERTMASSRSANSFY